jgi:hypothetical protein
MSTQGTLFTVVLFFVLGTIAGLKLAELGLDKISIDCITTGSAQVGNTFFACEPTAALINGEIVPFKAINREEANQ